MTITTGRQAVGAGRTVADELTGLLTPYFPGTLPVRVRGWDGSEAGPADAPTVVVQEPSALRRLLRHPGELGLAQAYVTGELDVDGDLLDGLRRVWRAVRRQAGRPRVTPVRAVQGVRSLARLGALGPPPPPPLSQARLRGRLHSARRDRAAIEHHYDLSNDFYALILDPQMAYSCGYFAGDGPGYGVEDAQRDKLDLVCRKLGLHQAGPGHRHLDVGCGWGSLALHVAERHAVPVLAVTISSEQQAFVERRAAERGLGDLVEVRLQDYRDLDVHADGRFGTMSSIEMGEHVGARNYPGFAGLFARMLEPGGRALVQQMSRRTRPGGGPFIEAFIAPDMHMRPVGETVELFEKAGLEVRDVHALREHYVRTVHAWYATFERNWARAVQLVGEETARVWRLYLVGGALAFEEGRMGVDQLLMVNRHHDGRSGMPAVRSC